jgi:hypothetical protein
MNEDESQKPLIKNSNPDSTNKALLRGNSSRKMPPRIRLGAKKNIQIEEIKEQDEEP